MKHVKQVVAPVGAFLGVALLISILTAPYFRSAERMPMSRTEVRLSQQVARMQ